ncbi:MAG: hypothetical protein AMJ54_09245 [Deltaproteobacteria bacterium SG8_13]|nr:MAG: hypothetical protein AMJ54_09245 [Deltaproteobacteria bacterium SG8_13]
MAAHSDYKKDLLTINQDIKELLTTGKSLAGMRSNSLGAWIKACDSLQHQLEKDIMRVAVVGAIKSGKSTFLNALLGGEYLKRGAGVVTSIVTRIRRGGRLKADLAFKDWEEINREISDAATLLPGLADREQESVDIRDDRLRQDLQAALNGLPTEQLFLQDLRNASTVLLSCYLNGFDQVSRQLTETTSNLEFSGRQFRQHWRYVGDDALAVYLKDVTLSVNSPALDSNTEFADCQGSDSPNPLHLAMIQDYLNLSHLTVYLISSRTGLREADIRFLNLIRRMGIIDNVLFVFNCDISEHATLQDLESLRKKATDELSLITPGAHLYAFSALYRLFGLLGDRLPDKERLRLDQWAGQTEIADYCTAQFERFQKDLQDHLIRKRTHLLFRNQVERHGAILAGMDSWISINRELVVREEGEVRQIRESFQRQKQRMNQIRSTIETTAAGAVPKIKSELNHDSNRFFDSRSGHCIGSVIDYVRGYQVDWRETEAMLENTGFMPTVYMVFQKFKQDLTTAMSERVYPDVVQFARQQEGKIEQFFASLFEPFESIVNGALEELAGSMQSFDIAGPVSMRDRRMELPPLESIKAAANLQPPPMVAFLRYSARLRTDALLKLGIVSFLKLVGKLAPNKEQRARSGRRRALQGNVRRMKKLTEDALLHQCKNYRENLKFAYLYKLVDLMAARLTESLLEGFQVYGDDAQTAGEGISQHHSDKERTVKTLTQMADSAGELGRKIADLRSNVSRIRA